MAVDLDWTELEDRHGTRRPSRSKEPSQRERDGRMPANATARSEPGREDNQMSSAMRRGGIPGPESRTGLTRPSMTEAEFERRLGSSTAPRSSPVP